LLNVANLVNSTRLLSTMRLLNYSNRSIIFSSPNTYEPKLRLFIVWYKLKSVMAIWCTPSRSDISRPGL